MTVEVVQGDEGPLAFPATPAGERAPIVAAVPLPQGTPMTVPRCGVSPVGDLLSRANGASRDRSVGRLATLLPGYDFEAAAQNADDRRLTVLRVSDELLEHLDGPGAVDRHLRTRDFAFTVSGLTFSRGDREGHQPPPPGVAKPLPHLSPNLGSMHIGGLAAALRDQWTTIINNADRFDPILAALLGDLMRVYGCGVNCNIYLSQGAAKGFGEHWDVHDTIIVQVFGSKRWSVFEPLVLSAQRPWIDRRVSDRPVWDGILEPGLALVIPRGWGHQVHGSEGLSMHYTLGVNRLEVHNLLDRLTWESGFWPSLRADVPFHRDEPALSYGGSVFDDEHGLHDAMDELMSTDLVDRAVAAFRARVPMRLMPKLTDTFRAVHDQDWSGLALRLPASTGVMLAIEEADASVVCYDSTAVRVQAEALDAFALLASGEVVAPSGLPPVCIDGVDERQRFATELIQANLAEVVSS